MPDLDYSIDGVSVVDATMVPTLSFSLSIRENTGVRVDSVGLQAQVMIEANRRQYAVAEQDLLVDLFGEASRYGKTLKTMLWTRLSVMVRGFQGETTAEIQVPCTSDLTIAAGRYFFALGNGTVPLSFQFSGTVFYRDGDDLQVSMIPWSKETTFGLPVATWRSAMERHHAENAYLCVRRDLAEALTRYKAKRGLATFDDVVAGLLASAHEEVSP